MNITMKFIISIFFLLFSLSAGAELIVLKNYGYLVAKVLEQNNTTVWIYVQDVGEISILKSNIKRIEDSDNLYNRLKELTEEKQRYEDAKKELAEYKRRILIAEQLEKEKTLQQFSPVHTAQAYSSLKKIINDTKQRIDCSLTNLDDTNLFSQLLDKRIKGIQMDIIAKSGTDDVNIRQLSNFGANVLPVEFGRAPGFDFFIQDGTFFWVSPFGMKNSGLMREDDTAIIFKSESYSHDILNSLRSMIAQQTKQDKSRAGKSRVRPETLEIKSESGIFMGDIYIESYMGVKKPWRSQFLRALRGAKRSITFYVPSMNDKELRDLVIKKAKEGVDIKGIFEKDDRSRGSNRLRNAIVDSFYNNSGYKIDTTIFVIDGQILVFGSYILDRKVWERYPQFVVFLYDKDIAARYEMLLEKILM